MLPAVTTQFDADLRVDLAATRAVQSALIEEGVHGLIALGTVGENNSLTAEEKRSVLRTAVEAAGSRVPVVAGVSELTTAAAVAFARGFYAAIVRGRGVDDAVSSGRMAILGLSADFHAANLAPGLAS